MTQTLTVIGPGGSPLPALYTPNAPAAKRTLEFFTAHIRNPNTRKAYATAAREFAAWCAEQGVPLISVQ